MGVVWLLFELLVQINDDNAKLQTYTTQNLKKFKCVQVLPSLRLPPRIGIDLNDFLLAELTSKVCLLAGRYIPFDLLFFSHIINPLIFPIQLANVRLRVKLKVVLFRNLS